MAELDRTYGGYRIFVGDLGPRVGKYELEKEFEYYGPLINVWVARNPPGFAFLVFKYKEDAEKCVRSIDGRTVCGRRVRVEHARPQPTRSRRPPPPSKWDPSMRCYTCGERGHFARDCEKERRYGRHSRETENVIRKPNHTDPNLFEIFGIELEWLIFAAVSESPIQQHALYKTKEMAGIITSFFDQTITSRIAPVRKCIYPL